MTTVEWLAKQFKQNHGIDLKLYQEFKEAIKIENACRRQDTNFGYGQGWADGRDGKKLTEPKLLTFKSE